MVKFTLKGISNLTESPAYFQQVNGIYRKDGALANTAALERLNTLLFLSGFWFAMVEVRRIKYLNNLVEQDHRSIKRITKYTLGFKKFNSAKATIAGIELCHMLKKGQMRGNSMMPAWQQFYTLAD